MHVEFNLYRSLRQKLCKNGISQHTHFSNKMERILKPDRLDLDPSVSETGSANKSYNHWKATFTNFLSILGTAADNEQKKFLILTNYVSPDIYNLISSQTDYASAVAVLDNTDNSDTI